MLQSTDEKFMQLNHPARLYWGARGARWAAATGCITVIVDVISFSTTVVAAVEVGIAIAPARDESEAQRLAIEHRGVRSYPRRDVPGLGRYSLSPSTFRNGNDASVVAVHSPNGARCVRNAEAAPCVMIGALTNASATGRKAAEIASASRRSIAVVACGELWPHETTDEPRFAIEDLLGAGAILRALELELSPEAMCAAAAFEGVRSKVNTVLSESGSGQELLQLGYSSDVDYASRYDTSTTIPTLRSDGTILALDSDVVQIS
jgi:2-phosphosulfolactate phosphatase